MAAKRRAETDLNQDNWDQEEQSEEVGCFKPVSEEVLGKRVIKTAKRRVTNNCTSESGTKSLFSNFSGFSSTPVSKSFSFLSKITNTANENVEFKKPSFSFLSKSNDDIDKKSPFSLAVNTDKAGSKSGADKQFSISSNSVVSNPADTDNIKPSLSFLSNVKSDCSSGDSKSSDLLFDKSNTDSKTFAFSIPSNAKTNDNFKLTFSSNSDINELKNLKNQGALKELEKLKKSDDLVNKCGDEKNPDDIFLQKLKSLNLLCAEWIIKHLNENLTYILTPVFDDYKKYLNQLREERKLNSISSNKKLKIDTKSETQVPAKNSTSFETPDFKESLSKVSFGAGFFSKPLEKKPDYIPNDKKEAPELSSNRLAETFNFNKSTTFMFGKNSTSETKLEMPKAQELETPKSTFFSFNSNNDGSLKNPFFNANSIAPVSQDKPEEEDGNQPPVIEDANLKEEGSVYDKKCKVFIKKGESFVDHGVGFLFLKLVGEDKKCQLIVRANNKLANIIINVLLSSNILLEKKGKNNVMVVCCPTPEAKPSVVLLKVKTEDDANQLLESMNKYKK